MLYVYREDVTFMIKEKIKPEIATNTLATTEKDTQADKIEVMRKYWEDLGEARKAIWLNKYLLDYLATKEASNRTPISTAMFYYEDRYSNYGEDIYAEIEVVGDTEGIPITYAISIDDFGSEEKIVNGREVLAVSMFYPRVICKIGHVAAIDIGKGSRIGILGFSNKLLYTFTRDSEEEFFKCSCDDTETKCFK